MGASTEKLSESVGALQVMEDLEEYLKTIPPRQLALSIPMLLAVFAYKYSDNEAHFSEMIDSALRPILVNKPELYKLLAKFETKVPPDMEI